MAFSTAFERNGQRRAVLKAEANTRTDFGTVPKGETIPLVAVIQSPPNETILKFGASNSVFAVEETVWEEGGLYTYLSTEGTVTIQSDNVLDTGQLIFVEGISGGVLTSENVTSDGTTSVPTANQYSRIFRASNDAGGDTQGRFTIEGTGADLGTIVASWGAENQTAMALWTCPDDCTAWLAAAAATTGAADEVEFFLYARPKGGNFRQFARAIVYQSTAELIATTPKSDGHGLVLPSGIDIEVRAKRLGGGPAKDITASMLIILQRA